MAVAYQWDMTPTLGRGRQEHVKRRQVVVNTRPRPAHRALTGRVNENAPSSHLMTGVHAMPDLVFVMVTGAFFALTALIVKGVERL